MPRRHRARRQPLRKLRLPRGKRGTYQLPPATTKQATTHRAHGGATNEGDHR